MFISILAFFIIIIFWVYFQSAIMGPLISFHLSQCFHKGGFGKKTRIPRLHARSSRSVFNLLTVKLISHPITQQLTPNWLLSLSYGWVCTWIYCRCAEVRASADYVISKSIRVHSVCECVCVCVRLWAWLRKLTKKKHILVICFQPRVTGFRVKDDEMHDKKKP